MTSVKNPVLVVPGTDFWVKVARAFPAGNADFFGSHDELDRYFVWTRKNLASGNMQQGRTSAAILVWDDLRNGFLKQELNPPEPSRVITSDGILLQVAHLTASERMEIGVLDALQTLTNVAAPLLWANDGEIIINDPKPTTQSGALINVSKRVKESYPDSKIVALTEDSEVWEALTPDGIHVVSPLHLFFRKDLARHTHDLSADRHPFVNAVPGKPMDYTRKGFQDVRRVSYKPRGR